MPKYTVDPNRIVDHSGCKEGLHPFKEISRTGLSFDRDEVVRWCPKCGAVVVDMDYDNRTSPGYYKKIEYPEITCKYGFENYNVGKSKKVVTAKVVSKKSNVVSPKMYVATHVSHNKEKIVEKVNIELINYAKDPTYSWVEISINDDYSVTLRNEVAKEFVKTGWTKVYHKTSAESGERPGFTTFVFLTEETITRWENCHSKDKYWCVTEKDVKKGE